MIKAAAGVLFTRRGKVLLVENSYKTDWNLPGGIIDPGETPYQAAGRELHEELGITRPPGRLLVVDHVVLPAGGLLIAYVFKGPHINTSNIRLDNNEIKRWEWCTIPQLDERTPTAPIFRNRVLAALGATGQGGRLKYLENGIFSHGGHHQHGTRNRYLKGCRCQPCTKANTDYAHGRQEQRRALALV